MKPVCLSPSQDTARFSRRWSWSWGSLISNTYDPRAERSLTRAVGRLMRHLRTPATISHKFANSRAQFSDRPNLQWGIISALSECRLWRRQSLLDPNQVLQTLALKRPIFHSEADFQHAFAWEIQTANPTA